MQAKLASIFAVCFSMFVGFYDLGPGDFPDLPDDHFRKNVSPDFSAVCRCACPFRRQRVAAPFGRARREGSEVADLNFAENVSF